MLYLQSLKLVVSNRSVQLNPTQYRRLKLIKKLQQQIECAKARADGRDYIITQQRTVKNPETNTKQYVQVPYRIKPWWYVDLNGKTILELRYGNKRIELAKGKAGIEVENMEKLAEILEQIVDAIEEGELDEALEVLAKKYERQIAGKIAKNSTAKLS